MQKKIFFCVSFQDPRTEIVSIYVCVWNGWNNYMCILKQNINTISLQGILESERGNKVFIAMMAHLTYSAISLPGISKHQESIPIG